MADARIRVSRALYRNALIDAIDWTESLIQAGNPDAVEDRKRLARYKRALAAIEGPKPPEPPVKTITLPELARRYREKGSTDD